MARTLHINVKDKVATYSQRDGFIVCGNSDYIIEFSFDAEWIGHTTKTARFISNGSYEDVVFSGNTVAVPVMHNTISVAIGVFSGNLKTTTPAIIACQKSILCDNGTPIAPSQDVYNQIIDLLNKGGGGTADTSKLESDIADHEERLETLEIHNPPGVLQTTYDMLRSFHSEGIEDVKEYVDSKAGGGGSGTGGGGVITVEVGYDASTDVATADRSASEIWELVYGGATVVAAVNGVNLYPFKCANFGANDAVVSVEFSFTEVGEQNDNVTTYGLTIDNYKDCTRWHNEFVGGGGVTPIFETGGVETLEAGESAYVNIDNSDPTAPILSFGIPKGEGGVSPSVAVTAITGGHRVSITDASGTKTFDVFDSVVSSQPENSLEIVSSIEEMTDHTKQYVLDGYIYESRTVVVEGETTYPNEFTPAADKLNLRLSGTSGSSSSSNGSFITDFIEVTDDFATASTYTVRMNKEAILGTQSKVVFYDGNNSRVGANILVSGTNTSIVDGTTVSDIKTQGDSSSVLPTDWTKVAVIKLQYQLKTTALEMADINDVTVTLDAKKAVGETTTKTEFVNTGESYNTPTDNNSLIQKNASDIADLQAEVEALKNNGSSGSTSASQSDTVWYAIGDSITAGYGVSKSECWVSHVLKYNGYDSTKSKNLGVSGIGFVRTDPTNGKTIRTVVDENSFANVDLVTVAVGINDWKESCSVDTMKTEMVYCFDKILSDNPYCKIFFITPINKIIGTQENNYALGYEVNGITMEQFVTTQMSVCKERGIEYIDMAHSSVVNRQNMATVFSDNTHPNAACHLAMGRELARKITFA